MVDLIFKAPPGYDLYMFERGRVHGIEHTVNIIKTFKETEKPIKGEV